MMQLKALQTIMQMNLQAKIPVTFGILTTENIEQALQRAYLKAGNEGSSTAQSLLEMISLNEQLQLLTILPKHN